MGRQQSQSSRCILRKIPFEGGRLLLTCDRIRDGHPWGGLVYYVPKNGKPRKLSLHPMYNFWDIQSGDVDGDGKPEIALCTWSKTRIVPIYARRYFVYGWDGHDVYPRWRGSRLSKPYVQARLVNLQGEKGMILLAVEITRNGRKCLTAYRWNDFGFTGLAGGDEHEFITLVPNSDNKPWVRMKDSGKPASLYAVQIENDRITLTRHLHPASNELRITTHNLRITTHAPRRSESK